MSQHLRTKGQHEGIEYTLKDLQRLLEQKDTQLEDVKAWLKDRQEWLRVHQQTQ